MELHKARRRSKSAVNVWKSASILSMRGVLGGRINVEKLGMLAPLPSLWRAIQITASMKALSSAQLRCALHHIASARPQR